MKRINHPLSIALVLLCFGLSIAGSAMAEKPAWAGSGQKEKHKQKGAKKDRDKDDDASRDDIRLRIGAYFDQLQQTRVRDYYADQIRSGHCPPGLAKKNNGCMPPGQAKKWEVGKRLPREVIFHDLQPEIRELLGMPPPSHRYVRVDDDILLITRSTGLVIDAILSPGGKE